MIPASHLGLAPDDVEAIALKEGVCIRPLSCAVTDRDSGDGRTVAIPCGSRDDSICPPCARKARDVRIWQLRQGWHLTDEDTEPDTELDSGDESLALDPNTDTDSELISCGVSDRRHRSTRRRDDMPNLPRAVMINTTLGRVFTDITTGRVFVPSMFITLTLPSYGPVGPDGAPLDPATYDYDRAVKDALTFGTLFDRFIQLLRRSAGYKVQYWASIEPQKRGAVHVHMAIRGTIPRSLVRQVIRATYASTWWPSTDVEYFTEESQPVYVPGIGYLDPTTREPLPTWDQALDALDNDPDATPWHVSRFGSQVDVQGILGGTREAEQKIRYLTKYLTKSLASPLAKSTSSTMAAHHRQLTTRARRLPCSPACAEWLRYGITPAGSNGTHRIGGCRKAAHKPARLGYAGRRVLVSRKWSGKTLLEHRNERRDHILTALGLDPTHYRETDATRDRYAWTLIPPHEAPPVIARTWTLITQRITWKQQLHQAQQKHSSIPTPRKDAA